MKQSFDIDKSKVSAQPEVSRMGINPTSIFLYTIGDNKVEAVFVRKKDLTEKADVC